MASSFPNFVLTGVYIVSDNHNFVAQQFPGKGYGYRVCGELSRFVYCILHKIKRNELLPSVDLWEDYILPNHSAFAAIEEEHFLVGTCVHTAVEKMSSSSLSNEFLTSARRFLAEFCSTILSAVTIKSRLGQGVSCFCCEFVLEPMPIPPFSCRGSY